jgi:hypothetical protein
MTGLHGYAGPQPEPGHFALSKSQLEAFVHDVNPEALAAYAKFLRGGTMAETAFTGFSAAVLQEKVHRIQNKFPAWIQKSGQQAKAAPFMQKLSTLVNEKKWRELDHVADQLLSMMAQGEKP